MKDAVAEAPLSLWHDSLWWPVLSVAKVVGRKGEGEVKITKHQWLKKLGVKMLEFVQIDSQKQKIHAI